MNDLGYCPRCDRQWRRLKSETVCPYCMILLVDERVSRTANGGSLERAGSVSPQAVIATELARKLVNNNHERLYDITAIKTDDLALVVAIAERAIAGTLNDRTLRPEQ